MVLKPWVLVASLLLQYHHQNQAAGQKRGIALGELTAQAVWLRDLSRQYGAFLHWPGTVVTQVFTIILLALCVLTWVIPIIFFFSTTDHIPPSEVVSSSLTLHRGLVRICEDKVQLAVEQGLYFFVCVSCFDFCILFVLFIFIPFNIRAILKPIYGVHLRHLAVTYIVQSSTYKANFL